MCNETGSLLLIIYKTPALTPNTHFGVALKIEVMKLAFEGPYNIVSIIHFISPYLGLRKVWRVYNCYSPCMEYGFSSSYTVFRKNLEMHSLRYMVTCNYFHFLCFLSLSSSLVLLLPSDYEIR